ILRQQLVYNALFQSCFNSSNNYPQQQSSATPFEVQIKVQATNPPQSLSVSFQLPDVMTDVLLQITILRGDSEPIVISQNPLWEDDGNTNNNTNSVLTRILQLSHDVPELVKWIFKSSVDNFKLVKEEELIKEEELMEI
ncbi:14001_t:CDS:2, partial [Racocetra fulgida]